MTADTDTLLTVPEAAKRYRVHRQTIRRWIRKGAIPHVRVGPYDAIRLKASDLERTVTTKDQIEQNGQSSERT